MLPPKRRINIVFLVIIIFFILRPVERLIESQFGRITVVVINVIVLIIIVGIDLISSITLSRKNFICLNCKHNFKPKFFRLFLRRSIRIPKKHRKYEQLGDGTYEQVYFKCPNCDEYGCLMKR